ncbi:MAG: uroporphyrinogen decarboxylase family protein [Elusimicrobia bacterium]|nr:uroporphyrinogen decarboxylase family protein [Elusimicrobiota bacterium]
MNKREIVLETLKHKDCGIVPYNIDFTIAMREKVRKYLGLASAEEVSGKLGNFLAQLNIGTVTGPSEGTIDEIYYSKKVGNNLYMDDWGVVWRKEPGDDIGVVADAPLKEDNLKKFKAPVPVSRGKYLEKFCKENPDRFRLVSLSSPIFQRAWFLRGMENFLVDMALNKEFVHELIDIIMEYTEKVVKEAIQYDIDAIMFFDDWGQQNGLIMSPQMWNEYIKPGIRKLCGIIKEKNKIVFMHSCGNIECVIPDLIEIGVDVLNPVQPEIMDVYKIKKLYGNNLSFYGGISTQELLPRGTVDEVKKDVMNKLKELGKNGGYILAPAHAVQADVPVENIMAFVETMQKQ